MSKEQRWQCAECGAYVPLEQQYQSLDWEAGIRGEARRYHVVNPRTEHRVCGPIRLCRVSDGAVFTFDQLRELRGWKNRGR